MAFLEATLFSLIVALTDYAFTLRTFSPIPLSGKAPAFVGIVRQGDELFRTESANNFIRQLAELPWVRN